MQTAELIEKINTSLKLEDIISVSDFKNEFNGILKEIHPDICKLNGASEATMKMNQYKDYFENGRQYKDDCGTFKTNGYWVEFESNEKNLSWSLENYNILINLKGDNDNHFKKYIPSDAVRLSASKVRFTFDKRAIPLSGLVLPQEHANWVLNRLLEYCAYLSELGMSHCGLTPESVFIIPENHGIQICSFYHLTKFGNKIGTISGKYQNWYPSEVFGTKIATPTIDIEMAKKIASYVLGDTSGTAIKLRKTHNEDFVNFIINQHDNAHNTLTAYKELLRKNFKKEFHLLNI